MLLSVKQIELPFLFLQTNALNPDKRNFIQEIYIWIAVYKIVLTR